VLRQNPIRTQKGLSLYVLNTLEGIFYWRWAILDAMEGREYRAERASKDWQTDLSPSLFYS
jgi:hypothetical protein